MITPQSVISCEYIRLEMVCHLLRPLGRWPSNTILIKLSYAKTQLVSQVYQWHTCWTSPRKKTQKASVIFTWRHLSQMLKWTRGATALLLERYLETWLLLWWMSVRSATLGKVWEWKGYCLWAVKNRYGGWASPSFHEVSWKRYYIYKISYV